LISRPKFSCSSISIQPRTCCNWPPMSQVSASCVSCRIPLIACRVLRVPTATLSYLGTTAKEKGDKDSSTEPVSALLHPASASASTPCYLFSFRPSWACTVGAKYRTSVTFQAWFGPCALAVHLLQRLGTKQAFRVMEYYLPLPHVILAISKVGRSDRLQKGWLRIRPGGFHGIVFVDFSMYWLCHGPDTVMYAAQLIENS
jgi:hypothetical protein